MNITNQEASPHRQGTFVPSGSASQDALKACLDTVLRKCLERNILKLSLPGQRISVKRALTLLDDIGAARTLAEAKGLDAEMPAQAKALVSGLDRLGLAYQFAETSWNPGGSVLMLAKPDALLRAAPKLVRLEPASHVFMLIRGRFEEPTRHQASRDKLAKWF